MIKNALLSSAVYPLVVSFIVTLALSKALPGKDQTRDWIAGLGVLLGFLACFYTTVEFDGFPPVRVFGWMPFIGAVGFVALLALAPLKPQVRLLGGAVAAVAGAYVYLGPVSRSWSGASFGGVLALVAVLWLIIWLTHEVSREDDEMPIRALLLVIAATGASLVSVISESAKQAQVAGGLAASVGALFLAWLPLRQLKLGPVATGVFMAIFGCLLLNGYFYVEVPLYALGLVALSGCAQLSLRLPMIQNMSGVKKTVVTCTLALIPILIAVGCLVAFAPAEDDYYDY